MSSRFGGGRGRGGGGMRGRKQQNGSFKIHNGSKLRPAPEKPFLDATETSRVVKGKGKGKGKLVPIDLEPKEEEEEELDEFGYREGLRPERRPLEGVVLCVTGATDVKSALLLEAKELGASTSKTLSIETTHLVANVAGSAKYEMAVLHKMKIMLPSWIAAVGEAWRGADDIDFATLERDHLMTAFHGLTISVTAFARGPHKDDFLATLALHGATISPGLTKQLTHLVVASTDSPHSQAGLSEKLKIISASRKLGRASTLMKVVWEGWAREAIAHGGVRAERESFWAWQEGVPEPVIEDETPVEKGARELKKQNMRGEDSFIGLDRTATTSKMLDIYGEGSEALNGGEEDRTTMMDLDKDGETLIPVATRKKAKGRHVTGLNSVDQLLSSYTNIPSAKIASTSTDASTSKSILPPGLVAPRRLDPKKDQNGTVEANRTKRPLEMERAEETGLRMGAKVGNSVIKAISTSRSTSFITAPTAIPRPFIRATSARDNSDDSAFFDDIPPTKAPTRSEPDPADAPEEIRLFEGLSFVLVETKGSEGIIRSTIEKQGGTVLENEDEDPSCYIMTLAFDAPERLRNSTHPRLVTECWLESCLYQEKVIEPTDRLVDRPVAFSCPVPGAEKLSLHCTNYDAVDKTHLTRYIRHIGATMREQFNPAFVTHLMHGALDEGETPTGLKAKNAVAASTPIVGIKWLKDFVDSATNARDEAVVERISAKDKGKGRESTADISENPRVLAGCVLFFNPRLDSTQQQRAKFLADAMGAKRTQIFSDDTTHLVHASSKAKDTFKEFKLAKAGSKFIVHPQWLEECSSTETRVNEVSFPHQYDIRKSHQLASLVIPSPPRNSPLPTPRRASPVTDAMDVDQVEIAVVQVASARAIRKSQQPTPDASANISRASKPEPPSRQADLDPFADPASAQPVRSPIAQTSARNSPPPVDAAVFPDVEKPAPAFVAPSIPSRTRQDLAESSMAMQAQLLAPLGAGGNTTGQRRARVSRKKSIPNNLPLQPPAIAPAYDPSRRIPGMGQLPDSDPFEEESMCVTFDDPASRKAREQIYAAVRGQVHVEDRSAEEAAARRREEDERLPKRRREDEEDTTRKGSRRR